MLSTLELEWQLPTYHHQPKMEISLNLCKVNIFFSYFIPFFLLELSNLCFDVCKFALRTSQCALTKNLWLGALQQRLWPRTSHKKICCKDIYNKKFVCNKEFCSNELDYWWVSLGLQSLEELHFVNFGILNELCVGNFIFLLVSFTPYDIFFGELSLMFRSLTSKWKCV